MGLGSSTRLKYVYFTIQYLDTFYKPGHGPRLYLAVSATFYLKLSVFGLKFIFLPWLESKEDKILQRKASVMLKISEEIL